MSNIKVSLDRQSFLSKPTDDDAARISNRIGRSVKQLRLSELGAFGCQAGHLRARLDHQLPADDCPRALVVGIILCAIHTRPSH